MQQSLIEKKALLKKYDVAGPRYTSYPPATQFNAEFKERDYLTALAPHTQQAEPLSLYLHLPFCQSICYYCACNKIVTKDRSVVRKYLDYLHKEMALMRFQLGVDNRPVTQLHWGGGTPTFLDVAEMTELMHVTAKFFNLISDDYRDYSIELDPRTVGNEELDLLRGLGFNRLSIGVQDFNADVQAAINRMQSYDSIARLVEHIRARGFRSLNFDLIYGLPNQTLKTLAETLALVLQLSPDRISFYNYAHMPDRFKSQRAIDRLQLPSAETKVELLNLIINTLVDAGYEYIGLDHFVKSSDSLAQAREKGKLTRNFQGYSIALAKDLVGIGVSSISSFDQVYVQNQRDLEKYYQLLDLNQLPIEQGLTLSYDDLLRREVIQQLSCYRCIDIDAFEQKYEIDFAQHFSSELQNLLPFVNDGIVEQDSCSIVITEKGYPFLRNVCMTFDAYLGTPKTLPTGERFRYSKTL